MDVKTFVWNLMINHSCSKFSFFPKLQLKFKKLISSTLVFFRESLLKLYGIKTEVIEDLAQVFYFKIVE